MMTAFIRPEAPQRRPRRVRSGTHALLAAAAAFAAAVWFLPAVSAQAEVTPSLRILAVHLFHPTNPQAYAQGYEQAQVPIEYRCQYGRFVVVGVGMDGQAQIGGHYTGIDLAITGLPACTGVTQSAVVTIALMVPGGAGKPMLPGLHAMTSVLAHNGDYPHWTLAGDNRNLLADTAPVDPQALAPVRLSLKPYRMHVHSSASTANATWLPPLDLNGHVVAGYRVSLLNQPAVLLPASARSYAYTGLLPHIQPVITVTVVFTDSTAGGSATDYWVTGQHPWLSQPVDNVVAQPGPTTMTVRWESPQTDGGSAVTGYLVARTGIDASGHGPSSTLVPGNATSCVFTNLRPGLPYTLTVRPVTAAGIGPAVYPVSAVVG